MNAWSGNNSDAMGPTVTRACSAKSTTPPLKNGNEMRESGYLIAVGSRTARFRRKHKNKMIILILLLLLIIFLCLAVTMTVLYVKQKRSKPIRICESKQCLRSAANLALSMDKSVDPCNDFYQYVCGNWPKEHPRPDAYSSYDWFNDKQRKVFATIRDFLAKNVTNEPKPVKQAKDIYSACIDTEELDKRGLKPVIKILESLGLPAYPTVINVTDDIDYSTYKFNWLEAVIKIKTLLGMDVLIGFDIFTDPKNSSVYRLVMGSPEATNPFPSFLIEKKRHVGRKSILLRKKEKHKNAPFVIDNKNKKKNVDNNNDDEEKTAHIYKLFYAEMMKLFVVEATAKNFSLTEVELDQNIFLSANEYYNMNEDMYELEDDVNVTTSDDEIYINIPEYTVEEIQEHTDMIVQDNDGVKMDIWKEYLEGIFKISNVDLDFKKDLILVSDPDLKYMSLMAAYVSKASPVSIELYIWIKVVEVMAVHTTTELRLLFQRSYDALRSRELSITPRSLQCASATNDMMGMAVSYAIADSHFFSDTKPKIEVMLHEMKNALARLVGKAKWMDDNTKLATYQKIIDMKSFVGFPDWLLHVDSLEKYYEGIEVSPKTHLENMIKIIQVKIRKALNKFRTGNEFAWATDPTEVNAYHTFQENTITVPLVMLQHPFFDLGLDSLNYGALGSVLGHEITHGFDDFGRRFDKNGNLLPWWSNDTIQSFVNMTQCFVDQYSNFYIPELGEHVDGKKTLGENIADNGGVRESFGALKEHLQKYGPEPKLPGFEEFTPEQLFFISYGNLWCEVSTKDSLKSGLSDEHSPQHLRARGALQNNADFSRIWKCPPDSPMNPTKRCIIY
ncbi:endothelin-converting enzyme 2-like [Danaus plexippus]|uniref:endothelin-converting enzyme 2-like n=1 Tax=Danaus plexippus TaxID=13037 RepID=UPI002AB2B0C3|nr:endothelin-converting enzyme 2-like [Danaus plexippus]